MDIELLQLRGNIYDSLSAYNRAQGRYLKAVAANAPIRIKCAEAEASLTAARQYELMLNSFLTHLIRLPPTSRTEREVVRFSDLKRLFDR
jgi:hypothetical protein